MSFARTAVATWRALSNACLRLALLLLVLRLVAPAPRPSDPPEMHAFYRRWLQPSWLVIVAPLAFALLAPLAWALLRVLWAVVEMHAQRWLAWRRFNATCRRAARAARARVREPTRRNDR